MLFRFIACLCCIIATVSPLKAGNIVAIVNSDIITQNNLKQRTRLVEITGDISMRDPAAIKKIALEGLIDDLLIFQQAKIFNISINNQQVEDYIKKWEQTGNLSPGYLWQVMQQHNISKEHFYDRMRAEIIKSYIVNEISGQIKVTSNEIETLLLHTSGLKIHAKVLVAKNDDAKTHRKMLALQQKIVGCNVDPLQYQEFATLEEVRSEYANLPPHLSRIIDNLGHQKKSKVMRVNGKDQIVLLCDTVEENAQNAQYLRASNILGNNKLRVQLQKYLAKIKKRSYIKILD